MLKWHPTKYQNLIKLVLKLAFGYGMVSVILGQANCPASFCAQAGTATAVSKHPCKCVEITVRDDLSSHNSSCPHTVWDQPAPGCILGIHREPKVQQKHVYSAWSKPSSQTVQFLSKTATGRKTTISRSACGSWGTGVHVWLKPISSLFLYADG